jgi:Ca2+-binding RTX toxin-like protein
VSEVDIDGGPRGERAPEITALEDGGYAVVWDRNQDYDDILVRSFDADGTPRTAALSLDAGGNNASPVIETLPSGEFLVVWIAGSGTQIVGQRFDAATGTTLGGTLALASVAAGEAAATVDLAVLAGGDFVVSWSESGADGAGSGLLARLFAADGTPLGAAFAVNGSTAGDQLAPSLTALPDGGFVASWVSDDGVENSAVFARAFDAAGQPLGDEFLVSAGLGGDQTNPEVTVLVDGRLAFSWSAPDGSGDGIYTRIVSLGTELHDNLQGDGQDDLLRGLGGADILVGAGGDDTLVGGAGADTLDGGGGSDLFVYQDLLDAGDLIQGFDATGADRLDLDALLDSLGVADVDRASRVQVQQAGTDQDAVIALDSDGDAIFETTLASVTTVAGTLDHNDLNLGTLV